MAAISGISVGAKTGTTSKNYDRWFCEITPYYTAATWYGYDYNELVRAGSNPAGRICSAVMKTIHKDLPNARFSDSKPSNITTARICKNSGKLATIFCENDQRGSQAYTEYCIKGTVPTEECTCHVGIDVCLDTGLLAGQYCKNRQTKVFITRPETETGDWSRAKDAEYMLITEYCKAHTAPPEETITSEKPEKPEKPDDSDNKPGEGNTTGGNTTEGNNINVNGVVIENIDE